MGEFLNGIVEAADYVFWRKGPTVFTQSGYNSWLASLN
jgi:hypothetical protein